jgi:poly(A) polymerase
MGGDGSHDRELEQTAGAGGVKLPDAPWRQREGMAGLLAALGAGAGGTRFVGGCVRDTLLDLPSNDVDLATRLLPEEVLRRLRGSGIRAVPTGLAHGTITAVLPSGAVEITTLRRDVSTDGRRATIAYTGDWEEDAARRDFTINALSADPYSSALHDYFGGLQDLQNGRVRFIGDPLTRIAEDHLRILRFFRFHDRFGRGPPNCAALEACTIRANDLMALSRERIADELLKLLGHRDPSRTIELMVRKDILKPVLPEIGMGGVERLRELIDREAEAAIDPHALRRLSALLPPDPDAVALIAARLRMSSKASKRLVSAASPPGKNVLYPQILAYRIGLEEAVDRILLSGDDVSLLSDLSGWEKPRFSLGGGELIAMGLAPGPVVARTLQAIEHDWSESGFPAEPEAQRAIARKHVDQALRASQ